MVMSKYCMIREQCSQWALRSQVMSEEASHPSVGAFGEILLTHERGMFFRFSAHAQYRYLKTLGIRNQCSMSLFCANAVSDIDLHRFD